jgi:hypothetical protein
MFDDRWQFEPTIHHWDDCLPGLVPTEFDYGSFSPQMSGKNGSLAG